MRINESFGVDSKQDEDNRIMAKIIINDKVATVENALHIWKELKKVAEDIFSHFFA